MITRDELTRIAAIAGATPERLLRLTTASGTSIVVGQHPNGTMCADGFRAIMATWDEQYEPHVESVMFSGAALNHGILSAPRERLFATSLNADQTAACLRSREDWPQEAHAVVREDPLLDLSVIRIVSDELDEDQLDALVQDADAACAVEALLADVARVA